MSSAGQTTVSVIETLAGVGPPNTAIGVRLRVAVLLLGPGAMRPPLQHGRPGNRYEVAIGRSLAFCVHPLAAWRLTRRSIRAQILAGYFAAAYALVLAGLMFLS